MNKSLAYFQSGGPTAVINCSLKGVIDEALLHPEIEGIFGAKYGIEGLINDDLVSLDSLSQETIDCLAKTPGAALGSSRKKMPMDFKDPVYEKIIATLSAHHIGYLLVNGGNDSMDTCHRLSDLFAERKLAISVIGVPKTIDNDLALTDHSIGYPSAARHVINSTAMIIDDAKAYRKGKIVLVEIMGRDTGWLTAAVDLLPENRRPDLIYVPEMAWDEADFLKRVQTIYEQKGYAVCALSEGMPIRHLNDCGVDSFGHHPLEGCCLALGHIIDEKLHIANRTIELSIPTRSDPHLRSPIDVEEATKAGAFAVKAALKGENGKMVVLKRLSSHPYQTEFALAPVEKIADKTIYLPQDYLHDPTRLSDAFRNYLRPLLGTEIVYPAAKLF
jgi:ATP-dependent phosphofructokinase / diphosphate-dependent phosphofructokinase